METGESLNKGNEMAKLTVVGKTFKVPNDSRYVEVVVENTIENFRWKLRSGKYETEWTSHYEGVLVLKTSDGTFGYATDYWNGSLPTEVPFQIIEGK
jgi:hypothetical protein